MPSELKWYKWRHCQLFHAIEQPTAFDQTHSMYGKCTKCIFIFKPNEKVEVRKKQVNGFWKCLKSDVWNWQNAKSLSVSFSLSHSPFVVCVSIQFFDFLAVCSCFRTDFSPRAEHFCAENILLRHNFHTCTSLRRTMRHGSIHQCFALIGNEATRINHSWIFVPIWTRPFADPSTFAALDWFACLHVCESFIGYEWCLSPSG